MRLLKTCVAHRLTKLNTDHTFTKTCMSLVEIIALKAEEKELAVCQLLN